MPYHAANGIPIAAGYTLQSSFPTQGKFARGFTKVDAFVIGTEAVFQLLEENDPAAQGWQDDRSQEMYMGNGFNSVPVETPFVAIRFRVFPGTLLASTGTINVRLLG